MDFFKVRTTSPYLLYVHLCPCTYTCIFPAFEKDYHAFGYKNYSNFREVRQVFIGFNWLNFQSGL